MSKFASGKNAKAISDRSGFQYPYRLMRREWNGLLVGPDEFEPKHPQLGPFRKVSDPQALVDSRPEQDLESQRSTQYGFNPVGFKTLAGLAEDNDLVATGQVGTVSVEEGGVASVTGSSSTGSVGSVTVLIANVISAVTGSAGTSSVGSVTVASNVTNYAVTVASGTNAYGTGNKYYIDGSVSPTLTLNEGSTYWFDQSDSSNSGHPLRFSTTANGTHGGGSEYTTGVVKDDSAYTTQITVAGGAPTLYYYCSNHSGMGGQANTP